jgi:transposase-like protein
MDHMDFREIGKLVSEDRFSLEYLWKKRGNTVCPSCSSCEFYYHQSWRVRCKGCKKDYWPLQGTRFATTDTIIGGKIYLKSWWI